MLNFADLKNARAYANANRQQRAQWLEMCRALLANPASIPAAARKFKVTTNQMTEGLRAAVIILEDL
jgi:hypothetical protein